MKFKGLLCAYLPLSAALMAATTTPLAFANATAQPNATAPVTTTRPIKEKAQSGVNFEPGLWKEHVATHIWGPFTKHQVHKECWRTPTPHLTDQKTAQHCKHVKVVREGNTYTVDEDCPISGKLAHLHISRTYAGNSATEGGIIKLKDITVHLKAHAKRIGKCPTDTRH